jgi:hypothetical protein
VYKDMLAEPRCKVMSYEGETRGATWEGTPEVPYEVVVTVMPLKVCKAGCWDEKGVIVPSGVFLPPINREDPCN